MIRYLTAGESHGQALVGIIEGVPAGLSISTEYIDHQLKRRQMGYGRGGRMKIETDRVEILSGVRSGKTLGSPIALLIRNNDWVNWKNTMAVGLPDSEAKKITIPRPGHADYAGYVKYGFDDIRNVIERASARETAMRVACCTITRKLLEEFGVFIGSHVLSIGTIGPAKRGSVDRRIAKLTESSCGAYKVTEEADKSEVRMLDTKLSAKAISEIKRTKKKGDTLGGIFEILVTGVPVGLGSYAHHDRKLDGQLCQALASIHAVKGVEVGEAFYGSARFGSEVHDEFRLDGKRLTRSSNNAGGIEGGVTNGMPIVMKGAMKPISTLAKPLKSVDLSSGREVDSRYERSDVCAVPACSVIGEAVVATVLANAFLEKFGGDNIQQMRGRHSQVK